MLISAFVTFKHNDIAIMTPREITSIMHKLFAYDVKGAEPWRHLMKEGQLDHAACLAFLREYITDEFVLVFVDSQHAVKCAIDEAPSIIEDFMKIRRVKVANLSFTAKLVVDPIGVGQGERRL
jgi:hypothetical protein